LQGAAIMLDTGRAVKAEDSYSDSLRETMEDRLRQGSEAGPGPAGANDAAVVAKRLVFHVGGYEPLNPDAMYRRFAREIRRFETTWSVTASVSPAEMDENGATWRVATTGPNWRVDTYYRLLRWDDLIEAAGRQPMWRRIPRAFLAFLDFVAGGALWGYFRTNWRYALFFLYPYLLFAGLVAIAVFTGNFVADAVDSTLVGIAAGALVFVLLLRWPGRRLYLPLMFDDWIFARTYVRRGDPVLDARLDRVAESITAASRAGGMDEIVVVGHSLGAVLAVDLVARALQIDPDLGCSGPRVALLSIGSSIPKIGLHRAARRFHAAIERVAAAPGVFWAEYQAIIDVMNFYKTDPVADLGLKPTGKPVVRVVRISRMLDPAFYKRIKRDFFRLHRQFVSGNDRRATYDYFMLLCGPPPVERQVRAPEGAASLIGPDGALLGPAGGGSSTAIRQERP
jgi:hypothetical protein